ncbi:MAG: condensation domain-containing protein, partial [bacterium]
MSILQKGLKLSPEEKRALLADLLRKKSKQARTVATSFAQQRLWFLDQLDPQSAAFNIARATRIRGRLDVEALTNALNILVARHESLRTNFALADGEPAQVISSPQEIDLAIVDLQGLDHGAEDEARRLAAEASDCGFDL